MLKFIDIQGICEVAKDADAVVDNTFASLYLQRPLELGARHSLRMEQHSDSALDLAHWLEQQSCVRFVRYPFLPSHPQHDTARRQMAAGSGLVAVEFDFDADAALAFCKRLELFTLAKNTGGVESLVCHPATMTHASVPSNIRKAVGISDGLIRFSIGIEDTEDLRNDIAAGLQGV